MKTYCKGLELTRKSVVEALHRWKKSDSGKENGWRVADEYGTETAFVDRIWLELSTETLTFEPIRTYLKHDPNNGKLREISVESIKRQVCNYLSLRLAAFVISFAYHAVEEAAKERRGKRVRLAGCQVWYADDGYFLGNSKRSLRKAAAIAARVLGRLGLSLKPWKVRRNGAEPIDFAGYRIWCARGRRVDLRKRLWKRLRRAFARYRRRRTERLARRVCSYWGWLKTAVMEHQMNAKRCIFNAARAVG